MNVSNLTISNNVFVAHQPRAWKTMWWDFIRVKCGVSLRTPSGVNLRLFELFFQYAMSE